MNAEPTAKNEEEDEDKFVDWSLRRREGEDEGEDEDDEDEEEDDESMNRIKSKKKRRSVYEELAEKEQALLMAAQFGKSLIDEKEELERHIETMKREHQNQLEIYEQETFKFKRLIDTMRNEYESKIYDLNEDIGLLNKQLKQKEADLASNFGAPKIENDNFELIEELNEKNEYLLNQLKSYETQLEMSNEKCELLESRLSDKEKSLADNKKLIINYQLEINKLVNKQKDIEFVLGQTCSEREKQAKIMEDLSNKYILIENEKNELEHVIFQHENEIFNLRRLNKSFLLKLGNYSSNLEQKRKSHSTITNDDDELIENNLNATCKKSSSSSSSKFKNNSINLMPKFLHTAINSNSNSNNSYSFDEFNSNSNLDNNSEFDDDLEIVGSHNFLDPFRQNEIEQDDNMEEINNDDDDPLTNFLDHHHHQILYEEGVNWEQESNEQKLNDNCENKT